MKDDSLAPSKPPGPNTSWAMRELSRLDKSKADTTYVGKMEQLFDEKHKQLGRDVANLKKVVNDTRQSVGHHPCTKEKDWAGMHVHLAQLSEAQKNMMESQASLAESQTFWSRWFMRGMIGFIIFLLGTGGVWVYSYFTIKTKSEEAQETSIEVKKLVTDMQQAQKAQVQTIKGLYTAQDSQEEQTRAKMRQEMKQMFKEVLAESRRRP
jgi:hypothetical protein